MENTKESKFCPSTGGTSHSDWEYIGVHFCPCGEFVAHMSNKHCEVIKTTEIKESSSEPKTCECRPDTCHCGDFLSHRVFEPCTAK